MQPTRSSASTAADAGVLPGLDTAAVRGEAEVFALLHTMLQAYNDLQLRVGQLEHDAHIRAALRPHRDLGIDY